MDCCILFGIVQYLMFATKITMQLNVEWEKKIKKQQKLSLILASI